MAPLTVTGARSVPACSRLVPCTFSPQGRVGARVPGFGANFALITVHSTVHSTVNSTVHHLPSMVHSDHFHNKVLRKTWNPGTVPFVQ
jgi:hypothetical protein